jgi:4-hydroxy-3-polyprenylbenzoate decarboxylase
MTDLASPPVGASRSVNYTDLRDWIGKADEIGLLRRVDGAHWDLEIGALTEMLHHHTPRPTAVLFDEIVGYPRGWRIVSNLFVHQELAAMSLGLPMYVSQGEFVQAWRRKSRTLRLTPPREVGDGPVMEHVRRGSDIDLWSFPTPRWHELDGGRYLGTGDAVITRDPETGQINLGTYRMMVQDRDKLGLYISPGHHGRIHRDKYFARGEAMPVAAVFGMDPLMYAAAGFGLPPTVDEYDWIGAVRGEPVEIIRGPVTGLPIPANAEIVAEGFMDPNSRMDEGPFGEFTGYYASAVRAEPYVQVEGLYHRNDPIILGSPPRRPPADYFHVRFTLLLGLIWDTLEAAGIPDVKGVAHIPAAGYGMLVISITQRYAGHAKQAAMIAAQSSGAAYLGRYIVVVDDDIDPYNVDDVLWAMWSRSDPEDSADLVRHCWSTPLDPRIPPEKRARGEFSNSRMIIDATRPFHWRNEFPAVVGATPELRARMRQKWGEALFQ